MMKKLKDKFLLISEEKQLKAMRYMSSSAARLDVPCLHKDHIKYAALALEWLTQELLDICEDKKQTNISAIFNARVAFHITREALRNYSKDEILRVEKTWYLRSLKGL